MSYTEMSKKSLLWCPCKIISFFIFLLLEIEGFLLLEIEGFLLLEIGADFSYWKLMLASLVLSRTFRLPHLSTTVYLIYQQTTTKDRTYPNVALSRRITSATLREPADKRQ